MLILASTNLPRSTWPNTQAQWLQEITKISTRSQWSTLTSLYSTNTNLMTLDLLDQSHKPNGFKRCSLSLIRSHLIFTLTHKKKINLMYAKTQQGCNKSYKNLSTITLVSSWLLEFFSCQWRGMTTPCINLDTCVLLLLVKRYEEDHLKDDWITLETKKN